MLKKVVFWMVAFCLAVFGAEAGIPGDDATSNEPQFSRQKDDLDDMLGRLESLVNKVDTKKIITVEDDVDMNELLDKYPEKMNALDEEASRDQQMNRQFIDLLAPHQRRMKALHSKLTSIESQAKAAKIVPDRSFLQRFSSTELQEYKNFLSSEGLSRMRQMYPEIFKKQPDPEAPLQTAGMMSGPNSDAAPGEYYDTSSVVSFATAGCSSDYLSCRNLCNILIIFKWLCKGGCLLEYIACKLS